MKIFERTENARLFKTDRTNKLVFVWYGGADIFAFGYQGEEVRRLSPRDASYDSVYQLLKRLTGDYPPTGRII
jgi:hypothetical protein